MTSKMRRASLETIERMVKDVTATQASAARDRRLSLTMMNCIWARNTDVETTEPVVGGVTGRTQKASKKKHRCKAHCIFPAICACVCARAHTPASIFAQRNCAQQPNDVI